MEKTKIRPLADIIKNIPKRWVELVQDKIDGRTTEGRNAWEALERYHKTKDTKKRGLLENLLVLFDGRFMDIINAEPEDYQESVEGRCACGEGLSKEVYLMRIRGRAVKDGKESQIIAKIKDMISLSATDLSAHGLYMLGSTCYKDIDHLLNYVGGEREEDLAKTRKKKSEELEEVTPEISPELKARLVELDIDEEQFQRLHHFIKDASDLSEEGDILFALDPGKNRSFGNWFREGISIGTINNEDIVKIYHRLKRAPVSLTTKDLAALTTYSYEYRTFDTRAVIGGVKDDLLYLSGLDNNDPLIRRFGRFNIDKHYVRPATRFRERKGLEQVTIREKLEQSKMSFLEAIGIGLHFSDIKDRETGKQVSIRDVRIQANRQTSDTYGVGQHWYYILKELKPVFEEVKAELAGEYKKFGEVVKEHVLTKDEYNLAKRFFKRSSIGRGTERENYLRMHSIRQFREIAPQIAVVGRKIRYARRIYDGTGDEELKDNALRQEYFSKEELEDRFEALTGIQEDPDKVIDIIVNSGFVDSKSFLKFQGDHGQIIGEMYANGLLAKRYLNKTGKSKECVLKRQYNNIRFCVKEVDAETKEKLEKIAEWTGLPFVEYSGPFSADRIRAIKYVSRKGISTINKLYLDIKKVLGEIGLEESDSKRFKENKAELESRGRVLYLSEGEYSSLLSEAIYDIKNMKVTPAPSYLQRDKKREYEVSAYNVKGIEEAVKNINSGIEVNKSFLRKLEAISNADLRAMGSDKYCSLLHLRQGNYDRVIISRAMKQEVEELYAKIRKI